MTPEQWQQIKELFESALERDLKSVLPFSIKPVTATNCCAERSSRCLLPMKKVKASWKSLP